MFATASLLPLPALLGYALVCRALWQQRARGAAAEGPVSAADALPAPRLWLIALASALIHLSGLALAGSINFCASLSWVSALMAALSSALLLRQGERFLPFLSLGVAMAALLLHLVVPGADKSVSGWQLHLHASVALLAYAALSLAGVQALLLLAVERRLKSPGFARTQRLDSKGGVGKIESWLPPLSRLERQLFQLIGVGFGLLTLTLLSGALFISNWSTQHLVHKTVLTVLAWLVFGALLLGHWRLGWRGRHAALATLTGMGLLALAFFGSKFALEIVLKRGLS